MKITKWKELRHKQLWINGMTGMTWGFIATLIVGTIIGLFGIEQNNDFSNFVNSIKGVLTFVCPFAIGIGIGIKSKLSPLQVMALAIMALIIGRSLVKPSIQLASNDIKWTIQAVNIDLKNFASPGDVFGAFLGSIVGLYFFKIFKWDSLMDIIIVPLLGILLGMLGMLFITYITSFLLVSIEWVIYNSANKVHWLGILLAPVIGVLMGLALSLPTSSAAIAFAISLKGDAATAAIAGTAAQMISFGLLTYLSTQKISTSLAVAFGTSMLQMKNFSRHPVLLLIPCLASGLCALIGVAVLPLDFLPRSATSGMGTCALYGQIFTLVENGFNNYKAYLNVMIIQIVLPLVITLTLAYFIINHLKWIKKDWLII